MIDNSKLEIHENLKQNFEKSELHQLAGDKAYVDDVVLDHTCLGVAAWEIYFSKLLRKPESPISGVFIYAENYSDTISGRFNTIKGLF